MRAPPCAPSSTTSSPSLAAGTRGDVDHAHVHGDGAGDRAATAADEHLGLAGHAPRVAVGVADRHRRDARRGLRLPQPAVRRRARRPAARAARRCATSATWPATGPRSAPTATPSSRRAPGPGGRGRSARRRSAASRRSWRRAPAPSANPAAATRRRAASNRASCSCVGAASSASADGQVRAEPGQLHRRRRAQPREHRVEPLGPHAEARHAGVDLQVQRRRAPAAISSAARANFSTSPSSATTGVRR